MDSTSGCHSCNICNKIYSSYKSLWNHNKKFHNNDVIESNITVIKSNNTIYNCRYCNKQFKLRQYRWSHEKTCKTKIPDKNIQETIKELKQQVALLLKEKGRIHHLSLIHISEPTRPY